MTAQLLVESAKLTPITKLKPHPKNPRRGDIAAIRSSIRENGFYSMIVAQKSTGHILVGNHRYFAAKEEGLDKILVAWVDVDDAHALKIMLADNRSGDFADYDDEALVAVMNELIALGATLEGTGYDDEDMKALAAHELASVMPTPVSAPGRAREIPASYLYANPAGAHAKLDPTNHGATLVAPAASPPSKPATANGGAVVTEATNNAPAMATDQFGEDAVPNRLYAHELPHHAIMLANNPMGIPDLDLNLCAKHITVPVITYGVMHKARTVGTLLFYTDDRRFASIWSNPNTPVEMRPDVVIEANFSCTSFTPKAVVLYHIYRKRWMARYWQTLGIPVIVDLYVDFPHTQENLIGVPDGWSAFATRAYSDGAEDTILRAYEVACAKRGGTDVLFIVYGGGAKAEKLCTRNGWHYIPEAVRVIRGEDPAFGGDYSWLRENQDLSDKKYGPHNTQKPPVP